MQYDLPAIRTLWSEGTDVLSSPSGLQSTTGCIPSADLCETGYLSDRNHRTESQKSDVHRDAPEVRSVHRVLPMLLPVQNPLRGLSLSEEEIDKKLTGYFANHPVLTRSNMQSLCCFTQSMASRQIRRLKAEGKLQNIGKPTQPIYVAGTGYYEK